MDLEGVLKEIVWEGLQADIHEFTAGNAPEHLKPHDTIDCSGATSSSCLPQIVPAALLAAALVSVTILLFNQYYYRKPKPKPRIPSSASNRIVVVDFHPFPLASAPVASPSSSVAQVEAMLRFGDVKYTKRLGLPGPDSAPMSGRAGYFQDGDSISISDPYLIIRHLIDEEIISDEFEYPEDPVQRATALTIQRVCETDLQAAIAYFRYFVDENWQVTKSVLGSSEFRFPWPFKQLMLRQLRVSMLRRIVEQRMGRRTVSEVLSMVTLELQAIDTILEASGGPYIFGDGPFAVDAAVFGVLDQFVNAASLAPQLAVAVWEFPRLEKFVAHIRSEYFDEDYIEEVKWEGKNAAKLNKKNA